MVLAQRFAVVILIIAAMLAWSIGIADAADSKTSPKTDSVKLSLTPPTLKRAGGRSIAPDFTLRSMGGEPVHLHDYQGHVVLIDFWATWCPPCRASIPDLVSIYDSCHAAGFDILGITFERPRATALPSFVTQSKIKYPVLIGDRDVSASYGNVTALPTSVLVGRDGTIRQQWIGLQPHGVIEKAVQDLLKEKAPN